MPHENEAPLTETSGDQPLAWALVDDVVGHANQVIGLASKLGISYRIKALEYSKWSALPHWLTGARMIGLTKPCRERLEKELQRENPKLIIAAGRKMASPARWMKAHHPSTKLVQILWPGEPSQMFDCIITPKHDEVEGNNVLTTLTALNGLTPEALAREGQHFSMLEEVRELPRPWVSCLIGGSSKHGPYSSADYSEMLSRAKHLCEGGSLIISTSRRTDPSALALIKETCEGTPYYLYDAQGAKQNHYLGILSACDAHVISGESVSMISEGTMTGLPLYVYVPDCLWDKETKITRFHDALVDANAIQILSKESSLDGWSPDVLPDETQRAADHIKRTFALS